LLDEHFQQVNDRLLQAIVSRVDSTQLADLGDALEEALASWDEHDQLPHVRVGVDDEGTADRERR
jgi:hypothetical protein